MEHHTKLYECLQRTLYHLAQMLVHWRAVDGVKVPAPAEIVGAEIANTRDWIELLGNAPADWVRVAPFAGALYNISAELPSYLERRIEVMESHRSHRP